MICAAITGSFPTSDALPDPQKNRLVLCLRLADELKLSLADVVPAIVADENLTKLRFTVTTPGGSAVKVLESFT